MKDIKEIKSLPIKPLDVLEREMVQLLKTAKRHDYIKNPFLKK